MKYTEKSDDNVRQYRIRGNKLIWVIQIEPTVYYNESWPLCTNEINANKEIDFVGKLILIDYSFHVFNEPELNSTLKITTMLRRRMQDAVGNLSYDVDVFASAYEEVELRSLSRNCRSKKLKPLLSQAYPSYCR